MSKRMLAFAGAVLILGIAGAALYLHLISPHQLTQSPYLTQLDSPVRGLSPQEVDDLLNGRGAGYARTAELNSYPGPRHVLDMRQELNLSAEQVAQIEATFRQMQAEAQQLGQDIVEREARFSQNFADQTMTEAELQTQTAELAQLYGQLRVTHLQAHLYITPLLSAQQIARYNTLRGYTHAPEQLTPGINQHQNH
jgi:Spy/CpxP family protein refolding chaperone